MKKVSIVVPVYNVENYLKDCLDSLINQTLDDIEIILINDGSTDKSLNILFEYKKKYKDKIIIVNQENKGISVARNVGLKKCSGEYIGFVDSDDFVELDMFETLYNKIKKDNSDIVVCNYKKYITPTKSTKKVNVVENIDGDNLYENPSIINSIDYAPWNKLYKRELFNDITFPPNKKYEDLNTILKVFLKANKISKVNKCLYLYRINNEGETLTVNKKVNDILYILEDLIKYCKESNKYNLIEKELEKLCIDKLFYYLILSYKLRDIKYIKEFRNNIIIFLNKYFKKWRKYYLKSNFSFKTKLIMLNKLLFNLYILKKDKKRVLFISSTGGHLSELLQLNQLFDNYNSYLITEKTKSTIVLKSKYNHVYYLVYGSKEHLFSYIFKFIYNCLKSLILYIKIRPKIIITTGTHTAVPMCYIGKLFGSKIIFIETFANSKTKTLSGRLVYPIADTFIVQWESMLKLYPKAIYGGWIY